MTNEQTAEVDLYVATLKASVHSKADKYVIGSLFLGLWVAVSLLLVLLYTNVLTQHIGFEKTVLVGIAVIALGAWRND